MMKSIIKNGSRFNRLTIIKEIDKKINQRGRSTRIVLCKCECGNKTNSAYSDVKSGHTKSCGCLSKEKASQRRTHGLSKTKFSDVFYRLRSRCQNKIDKDYNSWGGRGIKCLWKNFQEFADDMYEDYLNHKKKHSKGNTRIDRIDNNGHYCKKNCRWATHKEQARNRRSNHLLTYKNKTQTITEWAEEFGLIRGTLSNRINKFGWSIERSLTEKPFIGKNKND